MTWGEIFTVTAAPTITGLLALFQSRKNTEKIREVHLTMNSRLDELIARTADVARAAGVLEGRDQARRDLTP